MRSLRTLLFVFILYSLSVAFGTEQEYVKNCDHAVTKKVAIIGSGIGGSSAAYFLKEKSKQFSDKVKFDITVFERDSIVGGRTRYYEPEDGVRVEIGASVFHNENYNIANFTSIFNLTTTEGPDLKTGIWDGSRFVFWESSWKFLNIINVLIRYGFSPKIAFDLADKVKDKYVSLYSLKDTHTWTSIRDFHSEIGIWNLTMKSLVDDLKEHAVSELCVEELIASATRVNYGQDITMNALPGYITLVGHSNTLGVIEGLATIANMAISHSDAVLMLNTAITSISQLEDSTFQLEFNSTAEKFDIVILAAPIELADLRFDGIKIPYTESREFQVTHTTVVTGTLSNGYFHQTEDVTLPGQILTVETNSVNFTSIAWKASSKIFPGQNIYKVFSRQKLTEEQLNQIFTVRGNTFRKEWKAYPKYNKKIKDALEIVLTENLYYVNAAEFSFSVMEGESVNAENIVNLIVKKFK